MATTEPIRFACDACGVSIKARAERAGQPCKCPQCGQQLWVPQAINLHSPIVTASQPQDPPRPQPTTHNEEEPTPPVILIESTAVRSTRDATQGWWARETARLQRPLSNRDKVATGCLGCLVTPCLAIGLLLCLGVLLPQADSDSSLSSDRVSATRQGRFTTSILTGEHGTIALVPGETSGGEVPAGTMQIFYDRMLEFIRAGDAHGLVELEQIDAMFWIEPGAECLMINPGVFTHEVRILSGKHRGKLGFVSRNHVWKANR